MSFAYAAITLPPRIHWLLANLVTLTLSILTAHDACAGKLDRVSDAARNPTRSSSNTNTDNSSNDSGSSVAVDDSDGQGLELVLYVLLAPWMVPLAAIEPHDVAVSAGFPRYPYAWPSSGSMIIDTQSDNEPPKELRPKRNWALQLGAESGYVFDRVWREGLNLRVQTASRIDFDANWSLFMERQPGAFKNLATGREHLVWRFAQSSAVQFHTSLGAQHLVDAQGTLSGVDIAYGFEIFPAKPLTISVEGALGNLRTAFAPRVRATLGAMVGRCEFLLGYEHQWIGGETLGGPFAGIRLWL